MTPLRLNGNEQQRAGTRLPVGPTGALKDVDTKYAQKQSRTADDFLIGKPLR